VSVERSTRRNRLLGGAMTDFGDAVRIGCARTLWKVVLVMIALATVGPCLWSKP